MIKIKKLYLNLYINLEKSIDIL